ncbi:MAG: hypothetical protein ACLQUR_11045, partial [Limisphaerales bacterium]
MTLFLTGDWKVPKTRRLESLRYVSQLQNSKKLGDFLNVDSEEGSYAYAYRPARSMAASPTTT